MNYWGMVRCITQNFTEYQIPYDTVLFLLHLSKIQTKRYKKSLVQHLLNAAKTRIPLFGKQQCPLTIACWLKWVEDMNKLEDLVLTAQHNREKYSKTWSPWKIFIHSDEGAAFLRS